FRSPDGPHAGGTGRHGRAGAALDQERVALLVLAIGDDEHVIAVARHVGILTQQQGHVLARHQSGRTQDVPRRVGAGRDGRRTRRRLRGMVQAAHSSPPSLPFSAAAASLAASISACAFSISSLLNSRADESIRWNSASKPSPCSTFSCTMPLSFFLVAATVPDRTRLFRARP